MMSFDDGATDGESDPHPVMFGRVEGVKQLVHDLRVDSDAGIPHGQAQAIAVHLFCFDQQLTRAIVHVNHRVRGVAEQVEDDLLELDTVAREVREIVGELRLKHDAVSLKFTPRQRHDLPRGFVQIDRLQRELLLAEQSA